ncbi:MULTISPECIES: NAD(P)/FAD-dependent oxidoreductase [Prauserella salsuginis group]|uniref:Flavin-dependent dehydrogenase n=2 Tax=Prauserella salsuginis group TaxID=2893672 RepID=A0A839XP04_9PSEU|nr:MULTISPECIES: NAD(P)/FAD-dependent oxidoreductase [Prauserella salsuginis group]MBB3661686.1 flavin-dependent dehydrogenase [Prauserella sediminis]MCR3719595.1 FADH2-dependent halogenase [Prauserella flava]MCR3735391.1 FADH2-dependent halogenase [Prauserella salsuginis]
MIQNSADYDVVVIGAGPAGSTAARQAALAGLRVLIMDRDPFPRFHIGESLLPYMSGLLNQLGLLEPMRMQGHPVKSGAEFSDTGGRFHRVCFTDQGPGRFHTTFQVERSRFDQFLLDSAVEAGATVRLQAEVDDIDLAAASDHDAPHVVHYTGPDGAARQVRASVLIDASGRTGLISTKLGLRKPVERLKMVALYRHYTGVREEFNPGWRGDVQIGNHAEGWVWAIPNSEGTLSVGSVMRKPTLRAAGDREQLLSTHISRIPRIVERLGTARPQGPARQESDFCYYADQVVGNRWFQVGDAAAFVDPIFSGGVYLAMTTGMQASVEAAAILDGSSTADESAGRFTSLYKTGYDTYFRLVQGFYEYEFDFGRLKSELPDTVDDKSVSLLLGGDFWGQANTFASELRSVPRWDLFEPFEVHYGCPAYPELERAERTGTPVEVGTA